ncbi:MAG: peptidoglycan DD-metalloendopeptidase family protein [Bacteroidales bacterium]|nr:peptidoglycan DD-metalloendopeptidase family protein [Bacteroidales bacterium]
MEELTIYLIKSTIVSGVFYLLYRYLLRKESFFAINRFYLLISILFAYLFPFIKINLNTNTVEPAVLNTINTVVNQFNFVEEVAIIEEETYRSTANHQQWWILPVATVSVAFLFRFLKNLFDVYKTIRANEKITQAKFTLVLFNQSQTFSFFRYIFISPFVWNSPKGKSIVAHELSHTKHKHSLDRLFIEILLIIFWMNPFIYLYRKALEEVHEFQADADATEKTSVKEYFNIVLQQSSANNYSPLMSPFSYKLIKKRIKMANYKSKPVKRLLLLIPILVSLFVLSISATKEISNTVQEERIRWSSLDDINYSIFDIDSEASDERLIKAGNVFTVLINRKGTLLMEAEVAAMNEVKPTLKSFLKSSGKYPETVRKDISLLGEVDVTRGEVSLQKDINTPDDAADELLESVFDAYYEIRNEAANKYFHKSLDACSKEELHAIKQLYPHRISILNSKNVEHYIHSNNDKTKPFNSPIRPEDLTKISSGYGMRKHPITKEVKKHNGIDYVAPLNTEILAISDGIVRKVNNNFTKGKGYGRFIIIDHKNGYSSLYSQLNEYKVKEGQKVKAGDVIGLLGSSGMSTGPHLHLEIKKDGQFIDPESVIKK